MTHFHLLVVMGYKNKQKLAVFPFIIALNILANYWWNYNLFHRQTMLKETLVDRKSVFSAEHESLATPLVSANAHHTNYTMYVQGVVPQNIESCTVEPRIP